ncbi:MAG: lysostaphin resistance A-like protein [Gemmataceae bacterium]
MSANDPTFDPDSIAPSSTDLQRSPTVGGDGAAPPEWHPELGLPERDIAQKPRWPHPNLGWSFLWCLLFLFVTQLPGGILAVVVAVGVVLLQPEKYPLSTLSNQIALLQSEPMRIGLAVGVFVIELSIVGFSLLVIRLVVGRDWMRQLAVRRPSLAHTLLTLASFPVLALMGNVVYNLLRTVWHVPSLSDYGVGGMEEMVDVASKWPAALAVLLIGLGPGIGEELWCRGFLGRGLVGNYGVVFGVLATSFFFGLIHGDPCQGTMAMVMGLWLHFVYLSTRSLLLPMLLHFLNNSFAVLASRLPSLQFLDAKPQDIPLSIYLTSLLLLLGVAYALYQSRARLEAKMPEQLLVWRPSYQGVEYPPDGSGTRVVHPAPSLTAAALAGGGFLLFVLACAAWLAQG